MAASDVEQILGYSFRQKGLLEEALTHPSCAKTYSNQRLEFLGDTVLGLMVAEILYRRFPKEKEGDLAKRHAALVRGETLSQWVVAKGLNQYLLLAAGEATSGGRDNPTNLEDLAEALFGAVYLDGGPDAVKATFEAHWDTLAQHEKAPPKDAKTTLQEWTQARGLPLPVYKLVGTDGPAHAPLFTIEVRLPDGTTCAATAATKRVAEREAARMMLEHIEGQNT